MSQPDVIERITARSEYRGGCLIWTGYINPRNRSPYFSVNNRKVKVARVACELEHGPAPAARPWALHLCGDPRCVRPDHLYWGTPTENQHDTVRHGRHHNVAKSVCMHGHPLDGRRRDGRRYCLTCNRER